MPAAPVQLHSSEPATTLAPLEPSLFATYQTPDDSPSAAREALRQVNLVMEQVKVMHEASQIAYNANTALQTNVQVSKLFESVGARRVHPLGVVPETTVDCWQSTEV